MANNGQKASKSAKNGQNFRKWPKWGKKCHAQNELRKTQKYFVSSAETIENGFPAFENTYPYVFRVVPKV